MSDGTGTWWERFIVIAFASAVVAIATQQIYVRYAPKKLAKSPATKEQLLDEFKGDLDVAKASVSTSYVEKFARKPNENEEKRDSSGGDSGGSGVDSKGLKNLLNNLAP